MSNDASGQTAKAYVNRSTKSVAMLFVGIACLSGCTDEKELAARIEQEITDATKVTASDLSFGDSDYGEDSKINLSLPDGQAVISTEDLVTTLAIIDKYRREHHEMRRTNGLTITGAEQDLILVAWGKSGLLRRSTKLTAVMVASMAYTDAFCRLPDLEILEAPGAGSDFSSIARCNPELKRLQIQSWDQSEGYEGLAGLTNLEELYIRGKVHDVTQIPQLETLNQLELYLADDNAASRAELEERLPECSITYLEADPNAESADL